MMQTKSAGSKTICLPLASEAEYAKVIQNPVIFRQFLLQQIKLHPELFPPGMDEGFWLHGNLHSTKQQFQMRRIVVLKTMEAYQIRPNFMMPYMIGKTDEVEKGLFLRQWGVSFEGLAYVFGRDENYWYRAYQGLGRFSIVGTTVKDPAKIPVHLVCDEKHSWWWGKRVYLPTTVGGGCFLGVDFVEGACTEELTAGYQTFRAEALHLNPHYSPQTFNLDGWEPTWNALKSLFPGAVLIACFLHVVLGIQRHCRRAKTIYNDVTQKLWHVYKAQTKREFAQRLRRLQEWGAQVDHDTVRHKLSNLGTKAPDLKLAFEFPQAHRTSNALDRLMHFQDRLLVGMQYFHGSQESALLQSRAMALLWNFHPYGRRTRSNNPYKSSAFEELNGFCYHENWLHNLLIAGSMNGYRQGL